MIYQDRTLKIEKAPESTEVIWKNLHYSFAQQTRRKILTIFITILVLGLSFGAMFGLKYLNYTAKHSYHNEAEIIINSVGTLSYYVTPLTPQQGSILSLISIGIYVVAKIINKLFDKLMIKLTYMEKRYNVPSFNSSCVKKTVFVKYFNSRPSLSIRVY